ncbi:MAG: 4Fe-4S dicluster domain-containing protein [candidate division WOR-3 bacterium]|nr:MAG: 4Fe-4S dicluster domain-containing protein [candidate division WOR-3 bacterium]
MNENQVINVSELDSKFADEVISYPGGEHLRKCFACGTCTAGCPVSEIDESYSPRRLIRQILFGMRVEVLTSAAIWYCLVCYRCFAHCPQSVNFPDLMRVLRYIAIREKYVTPDIVQRISEIDKRVQILRHDLIKYDVTKQKD